MTPDEARAAARKAGTRCEVCGKPEASPILWYNGVEHTVHRNCVAKAVGALTPPTAWAPGAARMALGPQSGHPALNFKR